MPTRPHRFALRPARLSFSHSETPAGAEMPSPYTLPSPSNGYLSLPSYTGTTPASTGGDNPPSTSGTATFSLPLTVTATWIPTTTLAADPAPSVLRVTENSSSSWSAAGYEAPPGDFSSTGNANDGFGDMTVVDSNGNTSSRTGWPSQFPVTGSTYSWTRNLSATATGTLTNFTSFVVATVKNSYSVQNVPITAALKIDQDLQVFAPATTTRLSATISNASGFTVDWVKISVDGGTPIAMAVTPGSPYNYFVNWVQPSGNPSEHTFKATAQIHDPLGSIPLSSTAASGNGRLADDIIADVRLQSIKFNNNILLTQDRTTAVPTPEFTWTSGSNSPATSNPAAYIQGNSVNFTMKLGSSSGAPLTGGAVIGYALKLQANPNTTNPTTNQADPALTLYDNSSTPTRCSSSVTVAATTPLDNWVAPYMTSFSTLNLYVKFTGLSNPIWSQIGSYASTNSTFGNTIFATIAGPTGLMSPPWVGVLNDACSWAKRTSDATSATTALASGLYASGQYNGGFTQDTDSTTSPETFYLSDFVYYDFATGTSALYGQCNDFSDFLVCASNAIGAIPLQSQRIAGPFQTNPITASPDPLFSDAAPRPWNYHQFTGATTFFDGCLRFQAYTTPANLSLQAYENGLIAPGNSAPAYPLFVPTIRNSRSNP